MKPLDIAVRVCTDDPEVARKAHEVLQRAVLGLAMDGITVESYIGPDESDTCVMTHDDDD